MAIETLPTSEPVSFEMQIDQIMAIERITPKQYANKLRELLKEAERMVSELERRGYGVIMTVENLGHSELNKLIPEIRSDYKRKEMKAVVFSQNIEVL